MIFVSLQSLVYYRVKPLNKTSYKIGDVAKLSGFSIQTLRYYEKENLIQPSGWTQSGYRLYNSSIFDTLKLIQHLKSLGFSLSEIRELNEMCSSGTAYTRDIKKKAQQKLAQLNSKLEILKTVQTKLEDAITRCPGDSSEVSECPIIHSKAIL